MSKAQKTANTFEEQDKLGRTYEGPNDPHIEADKERLGDMWIAPGGDEESLGTLASKVSGESQDKPKRLPPKKNFRSLSKYTRYYHKKDFNNG